MIIKRPLITKKEHVKTQLPLHIQDLLYPYIASPTESDSDFNRQNSEYKILPDEREYGDDFVKKSIKINPRNQKFINDISKALSTEKDLKNIIVGRFSIEAADSSWIYATFA